MKIGILPSVHSTKHKRVAKLVISVCSRIRTTKQKAKERPFFTTKEEKATTIMLWLLSKLYHTWVASRKTRKHWFLKVESLGGTRCKESWNQFKGYDSLSLRYVKRVSGKRKDHRWENYKSNFLISEVPHAVKFEDRSHEETERQQRFARSKAWNLAKKDKATLEEWYSWLRQQKSRRKESLQWISEQACVWSAGKTLTLPSWRP